MSIPIRPPERLLLANSRATRQMPADSQPPNPTILAFHQSMPGYNETRLVDLGSLGLGIGKVIVKDESCRMDLPSFKILGASWAVARALGEIVGVEVGHWDTLVEVADQVRRDCNLTLGAATDGNHGRALARVARLLGLSARIWVPSDMVRPRKEAIRSEGADVVPVRGHYDDAVIAASSSASDDLLIISDTSWPGYEQVPHWVIEGYSTIYVESDVQLETLGIGPPSHVFVPVGVGALAAATVLHYERKQPRPVIVGVEPAEAACVRAALEEGRVVTIDSSFRTSMAGLNCGTASSVAFPLLANGLDFTCSLTDDYAEEAVRFYARHRLVTGETGAAALGALRAVAAKERQALALTTHSTVLVLITEGATDPDSHARIISGSETT